MTRKPKAKYNTTRTTLSTPSRFCLPHFSLLREMITTLSTLPSLLLLRLNFLVDLAKAGSLHTQTSEWRCHETEGKRD